MMNSRRAIAVVGEGITEKYYIESLKGHTQFAVEPKALGQKASSLKELEIAIKNTIAKGYDEVYCLIDMDTKSEGKNREQYNRLKNKYHAKLHGNKNKGIQCKVLFIETERCIELWFLYHFAHTTRKFSSCTEIEKELQKHCPKYCKHDKYFRSIRNIHNHLTVKLKPCGSLKKAVENAKSSVETKNKDNRNHTYSEMHILINALEIPLE